MKQLTVGQLTALLATATMLAPVGSAGGPKPPAAQTAYTARRAPVAAQVQAAGTGAATTATVEAAAPGQNELTGADISVGFADSSSPTPNFPLPWQSAPNVVFIGSGSPWNAGTIRIDNPSSAPLAVQKVVVDLQRTGQTAGPVFDLWSSFIVPAQGSAILTQTATGNFNTSANPLVTCGQALAANETRIPKITVTIGGAAQTFLDTTHILDTGGASCQGNKSLAWRRIGVTGIARTVAKLTLSPGSGSANGGTPYQLTAQLTDASDLPLRNAAAGFRILSGPNQGRTGQAITDSQGLARFSYAGGDQGTDVVEASVDNAGGGYLQKSNQVTVAWQSIACTPSTGSGGGGGITALSYVGALTAQTGDPLMLAALLLGANGLPLGGRSVVFTLAGTAQSAVTDATGVARLTVTAGNPTTTTLSVSYAGEPGQTSATVERSIVIDREDSALRYTGRRLLGTGAAQTVSAVLRDADSQAPLAGRTVLFKLSSVTVPAVTDANGVATATMNLPASVTSGPTSLQVSFAGDTLYKPSTQGVPLEVYLASSFVVWGGNTGGLQIGQRVNFWGAQWPDQVIQGEFVANGEFKGFAEPVNQVALCQAAATASTLTNACWESKGGQSFPPPLAVPNYIQVLIPTLVVKKQGVIFGNIASSAVVQVEPGYGTSPGKEGWGKIVAVIFDTTVFPKPADLRITQTQPATVQPGQQVPIAVSITNASTQTGATGAVLTETLDGLTPGTATQTVGLVGTGATVVVPAINATVPAIPIRGGAETANDYIQRLFALNGRVYTATGQLQYSDGAGQIYAPIEASSSSTLQIPVLTVGLTGPDVVSPGGTVPFTMNITNIGGAAAASGTVGVQLPNGTSQTVTLGSIAAGATFTTVVPYTQTALAPRGAGETSAQYLARLIAAEGQTLSTSATLNWRDAAGNNYGDVQARAFTSTVRVPVVSVTTQGLPATALPGQELTLNVTAANSGGCTASPVTVKVTNPDGTVTTLPVFPLAAGQSNTLPAKYRVPVTASRDDAETEAQYLARLQATNNKALSFTAAANWSDPGGTAFGPSDVVSGITRETLPILTLALTGPASAQSGTTVNFGVAVTNSGLGASGLSSVVVTLPNLSVQTVAVPALAPGAAFSGVLPYAIPATQPAGAMSISGVLVWADPSGNLYGPFSGGAATTVTNPIAFNSLVLGPISSGPSIAGTTQTVTVTVKSGAGVPLPNTAVTFTVTGANATTGTATTNAAGVATFTYSGAIAGVDTVTVTATDPGGTVSVSNPVPVNWVTPVQSISSTTVYGRFFPNPGDSGAFNTPNTEKPVFGQAFANVNFGNVNPFRNNITDQNGTVIGTIVAAGGGYVAGNDSLLHFQAVFTGQFNVTSAGNVVLNLSNDDGFILGVGPNASGQQPTRVAGEMVGAPAGGRTAFENFPVVGAYNLGTNAADHTVTVNFPAAGSYPYELDYAECCASFQTMKMGVKTGPVTTPLTPTGVLTVTPGSYSTFNVGTSTTLTVTALSASGSPVGNLPLRISVAGVNPKELTLTTNAAGTATFPVTGTVSGRDYAQAISTINGMAVFSNSAELQWGGLFNLYSLEVPFETPGNILAPANLSEVRGPVNVTYRPPSVFFGNSGVLEYYPVANPADVRVINPNVGVNNTGQVMGVFDPAGLPNGEYVIRFRSALISTVQVRVTGENKPGRMRASVKDFTVPLAGIPITIGRTYDSLERSRVGDFGYGWDLSIAGPKLEVNSQADVTLTVGGKRMTFFMTPVSSGFPFPFWLTPGYTAERGTYGSLATVGGCPVVIQGANGRYLCFPETVTPYAPTSYVYTAPDGVKYEVGSDGKMISITDLSGNKLTFGANGITSTAGGASVPFLRDGSGRITRITDTLGNNYNYSYNAAGELVNVQYPLLTSPTLYEYSLDGRHFLTKETDPRGNSAQTTYTADGKLASVRTAEGHLTGFAYSPPDPLTGRTTTTQTNPDAGIETTITDVDGNVVERRDGLNRRSVLTYDTNNNLLTETNHLGETKTHTYDARGFRTSARDALGKMNTVTYNVYGGPTTMTDQLATVGSPGGNTRTIIYDAQVRPVTITDSLGQVVVVTYDAQGNIATLRDAIGKLSSFTYNSRGDKLTQTDPLNRVRRWSYDLMGRVKTETDARNGVTENTYDALGRKTEVKDALNAVTSKMEWDNEGNKTGDVDRLGRRTTYAYDLDNRLRLTTYPDATTMGATHDFRNQKLTETDQLSRVTKNEYDKAGQLTVVTKAFGTPVAGTMGYGYDGAGRKSSETDERGNATLYEFDAAGRMTKMTNARGEATEYGYDLRDQRTSVKDANGRTMRYAFDARGRMTTTTYPDNTTMVYGFDGMGRQTSVMDQAGKVTQKSYDDAGQLTSVTDALNQITRYAYDPNGNLASQTDAATRVTNYQWDALNRRTRRTLPLLMFETYGYDPVGNMTSRVDFKGKATAYGYDNLNRLTGKTPDASFFSGPTQFSYHLNGQRATMTDPSGATNYQYDARHRLTVKASPQGTLSYGYDAHGNVASMQSGNANGTWVEYAWDQLNRVASVVDRRLAVGTTTYSYDPVGNRKLTVYPNGVAHDFGYDTLDRLTAVPVTTANGTGTFAYTLGFAGNRLTATGLNGRTSTYGYDAVYRLMSELIASDPTTANNGTIGYGYDAVGNRLSMTSTLGVIPGRAYTYDANDRLSGETYDANGNTLTSGGYTYTYDYEDRLIQGNTVGFVYDGDGSRVRKTAGASVTRYLVDELNPTGYSQVVEEILNGSVQRTYTYGLQRISQDWAPPSPTAHFYVYDGHGSVRALTDIAGAVSDVYEYDAFGNLVAGSGKTANHNLYTGEHFEVDLGMYYLRARWYRPMTGRFLSQDKWEEPAKVPCCETSAEAGVPGARHLFTYTDADPVNNLDPTGLANIIEYESQSATSGLQSHHLVEQRLRENLVKLESKLVCILDAAIVLTKEEHQVYTNASRKQLPYKKPGGPKNCYTEEQVIKALEEIYKNDKDILDFIKKALESGVWP